MRKTWLLLCAALLSGCAQREEVPTTQPHVNYQRAALLNVTLAEHYMAHGQMARAQQKLLRAKNLNPHAVEVLVGFGNYHEALGDQSEAQAAYEEALRRHPRSSWAHQSYAAYLCRSGAYHVAEKHFQTALGDPANENMESTLMQAGWCALRQEHPQQAEQHFMKAVRYNARNAQAWLQLAQLAYQRGAYQAADAHWNAYESAPHELTPEALNLRIAICEHTGQLKEARFAVQNLVTLFPESPEAQARQEQDPP